jgi:hypothetical protein
MSDPLATYLHDYLAGSAHAIDLVKAIRDWQATTELGQFAAHLLGEIEADRDTLRGIADSLGAGTSALNEIGAWEEKISRLKLRDLDESGLGLLRRLRNPRKRALWSALGAIAPADARLRPRSFESLFERVEAKETQVEHRRLKLTLNAPRPS